MSVCYYHHCVLPTCVGKQSVAITYPYLFYTVEYLSEMISQTTTAQTAPYQGSQESDFHVFTLLKHFGSARYVTYSARRQKDRKNEIRDVYQIKQCR